MQEKKVFIQVQADESDRKKLAEIAKHRDSDMSKVVRGWIRETHKRMNK